MLGIFKTISLYLAAGVEAVAAIIIGIAAIEAAIRALPLFLRRGPVRAASHGDSLSGTQEDVRLRLARWLAVALEFELAADILRTAIAPTWTEIGQLAAIAVLRTGLNYFLQQEIDKAVRQHAASPDPAASAIRPGE